MNTILPLSPIATANAALFLDSMISKLEHDEQMPNRKLKRLVKERKMFVVEVELPVTMTGQEFGNHLVGVKILDDDTTYYASRQSIKSTIWQ
jgi:hypothetical protein